MEITPLSPEDEALYEEIQRRKRVLARRQRPIYWVAALLGLLGGIAAVAALATGALVPALCYLALVVSAAGFAMFSGRPRSWRGVVAALVVAAAAGASAWLAGQSPPDAPLVWLFPGGFALAFAASAACAVRLRRVRAVTRSHRAGLGSLAYLVYAVPLTIYVEANFQAAFHVRPPVVTGRIGVGPPIEVGLMFAQIAFLLIASAGVALAALFGILGAALAPASQADAAGPEGAEGTS